MDPGTLQRLAVALNFCAFALVAPQLIGLRRLQAIQSRLHGGLERLSSIVRSGHARSRQVSGRISILVAATMTVTGLVAWLTLLFAPGIVIVVGGALIYVLLAALGFWVLLISRVTRSGRSMYDAFGPPELLAGCFGMFAIAGLLIAVIGLVVLVVSPLVAIPLGVTSWLLSRVVSSLEARGALARYGVRAGVVCFVLASIAQLASITA